MHANSVLLIQDGTNMAQKKDNKKTNNDYRSGAALLKKQQEANTKKYKAMTPTQKKAYNIKQAKAIGKTAIGVASMVGGAGLARTAGAKVAGKVVASGVTKKTAAAARTRGKEYMEQKYFKTGTKYSDKMDVWGKGNKYLIPKKEELAKVAGNPKAGKSARLNPVGRVSRKADKIATKRDAQIVKDTARFVGVKDMRTARGVAKQVIKKARGK